jgi:hypothetical protein
MAAWGLRLVSWVSGDLLGEFQGECSELFDVALAASDGDWQQVSAEADGQGGTGGVSEQVTDWGNSDALNGGQRPFTPAGVALGAVAQCVFGDVKRQDARDVAVTSIRTQRAPAGGDGDEGADHIEYEEGARGWER